MPVPRFWTLVPTLTLILTLYLTLINIITTEELNKGNPAVPKKVRKIVAFSLKKQIELDSASVKCARIFETNTNQTNDSWRKVIGSNLFVYSVHFDARLHPDHYVRIIGVVKDKWNHQPLPILYCQVQSNQSVHITKATISHIWSKQWDSDTKTSVYYRPVLVSCKIPSHLFTPPTSLTLNAKPCHVNQFNNLSIPNLPTTTRKTMFTICVKPLHFNEDISKHLAQWIEINRVLGAGKIVFYVKKVPKKTLETLLWYANSSNGVVVVKKFVEVKKNSDLNFHHHIWQKRRYELVTYNDCFYENLSVSEYIIPLDIDEIIVPRQANSWQQLLNDTFTSAEDLQENFASFTVQNAYYLREFVQQHIDDEKEPVFFLRDRTRSELSVRGESGKSFIATKNTLTVFNHYAFDVLLPGVRKRHVLSSDYVQMNHYKNNCLAVILPECVKYLSSPIRVFDYVIDKFRNAFLEKYVPIMQLLNLGLIN